MLDHSGAHPIQVDIHQDIPEAFGLIYRSGMIPTSPKSPIPFLSLIVITGSYRKVTEPSAWIC